MFSQNAGHCWRSRDELISDVLLWSPTYGRAKAGRPAQTYIQQLCEDTGCSPEDLPEAMNHREKWRERVRDIRASGTTWWWWWWHIYIYMYIYARTHAHTHTHTHTHRNTHMYIYIIRQKLMMADLVSWSCRIHRLALCREVRFPQRVPWIWL